MRSPLTWLRSVLAMALGIVAINLVHLAGGRLLPDAYVLSDPHGWEPLFLTLTVLAGTAGTFVAVAVARHRPWLHMALFLAIMSVIDTMAILGPLAEHAPALNAVMLLTLPLQAWLGARFALLLPRAARNAARRD